MMRASPMAYYDSLTARARLLLLLLLRLLLLPLLLLLLLLLLLQALLRAPSTSRRGGSGGKAAREALLDLPDARGRTPADLARSEACDDVVTLLEGAVQVQA